MYLCVRACVCEREREETGGRKREGGEREERGGEKGGEIERGEREIGERGRGRERAGEGRERERQRETERQTETLFARLALTQAPSL